MVLGENTKMQMDTNKTRESRSLFPANSLQSINAENVLLLTNVMYLLPVSWSLVIRKEHTKL